MRYEHAYIPLESFEFDEAYRDGLPEDERDEYEGHLVMEMTRINELGGNGFRLVQVVVVDGIQHGWFVKEIDSQPIAYRPL